MNIDREELGKRVREVWIAWAKTQPEPKPSWLVPWEELAEEDREVDRQIGETIARESIVDLSQENESLDRENEDLDEELDSMREAKVRVESALTSAKTANEDLKEERGWFRGFCLLLILLLAGGAGLHFYFLPPPVEPVECPPPPPAPECPPVEECEGDAPSSATMSDRGYLDMNGERQEWPTADDYPAERFVEDCEAVCEVPTGFGRDATPGRVLLTDPSHLVCICFHERGTWPVERYIGWARAH